MQIVRDLAGYSYGRSDLVRRAMSKKKAKVMEEERQNFVYGNKDEGIAGCTGNGINESVANKIYDEMIDFAKYAFNKSHAAAYAVVAYETAYLKYYYPIEFMAALMTSVLDNMDKVSEYIMTCRQMGISILPPDINEGLSGFSVSGQAIRYGLSAIKGLGKPVIDAIVEERSQNGKFVSLKDVAERLSGKEINKRTMESFIKSGAFDSLPGTRKQKLQVYVQVIDSVNQDRKNNLSGQMSLFDLVENKEEFRQEVKMPDVGEFEKEQLLTFEKEVLGIYVSGHPLESYISVWKQQVTKRASDFSLNEQGESAVKDGYTETIGGMIINRTIKTTKTNSLMAFLTIEDLYGTVEVIVFPRDYEKYKNYFQDDAKIFITGKVKIEDEKPAKLILQRAVLFEENQVDIWVQFENKESFLEKELLLCEILEEYPGNCLVKIYCKQEKQQKILENKVSFELSLINRLKEHFLDENVKVVKKSIEK